MTIKSLRKIKEDLISPPKKGEIVEGTIINRGRSALFLDLGPKGIGVIFGKEFFAAKDELKNLKVGDSIFAKVTDIETPQGYRELSFNEAHQELAWQELLQDKTEGRVFEVQIKGANKGGLICQIKGIQGFLPASQLSQEHYPKVQGADPAKIAQELQKLVGQKMQVRIFDLDPRENKLIFSERNIKQAQDLPELHEYKTGDRVKGKISGITNFGAFLEFGKNVEGLIRNSDIPEEIKPKLKIGKQIEAQVAEIVDKRVYLKILPKKSK